MAVHPRLTRALGRAPAILLTCSLLGCYTTRSAIDVGERRELFRSYDRVLVDNGSLLLAYKLSSGRELWASLSIDALFEAGGASHDDMEIFNGALPRSVAERARQVPIEGTEYVDQEDLDRLDSCDAVFLGGTASGGVYVNRCAGGVRAAALPEPPTRGAYHAPWSYPARVVLVPLAVVADIVLSPLWLVVRTIRPSGG